MTYMDDLLTAMIIAGIGLSIAYLRAEFVSRRARNTKERKKAIVQRELHANRLRPKAIDVPVAASRNHQPFLSKQSALCAPAEWASNVYSRKSADVGIARYRELA
jgi:hypothetical protein